MKDGRDKVIAFTTSGINDAADAAARERVGADSKWFSNCVVCLQLCKGKRSSGAGN
jgi:hypothetical protein